MQRIHAADTVPVLPEAPKDGTPGYFSDGNAATGDMATVIDAAWCNGVQEELMAFLAATGVEPSAEDLGQVLASVKKLTDDAIKKYAAPIEHADGDPTYGLGNASSYGHVKLSDSTEADDLDAGGGTAASPKAVAEVMSVASGAAEAASNAQISADGAQNSANEAQTSADNAQESAEAAAQAVTRLEQNINLQLENMTARDYWQSRDDAVDADELLGVRCMYHLTEQASGSVHVPDGLEYPAFFSSGADQSGTVCVQYVLGGNVLYSRAAGSDGGSWQSTEWRRITYTAATTSALGVVKPDGSTVEVAADGTLSINSSLLSTVYKFKGSVATKDDLPSGASQGDVYNVTDTGVNYAWTGTTWDALSGIEQVDSSPVQNSTNPVSSGGVYTALGNLQTEFEEQIEQATSGLTPDNVTIASSGGKLRVKDVAIGGDTADLASARGQIGGCQNFLDPDFHTILKSGVWRVSGSNQKNAPGDSSLNAILISNATKDGAYCSHIYIRTLESNVVWVETYHANEGWQPWRRVALDDNFDASTMEWGTGGSIVAKDIAIGGDTGDLASERGFIYDQYAPWYGGSTTATYAITDFDEFTTPGVYHIRWREGAAYEDTDGVIWPVTANNPNVGNGASLWCDGILEVSQVSSSTYTSSWARLQHRLLVTSTANGALGRIITRAQTVSSSRAWSAWIKSVASGDIGDGITVNNGIISVPEYEGATGSAAGTSGLVPPASKGEQDKYLGGDGEWHTVPEGVTLSDSVTSTSSATAASSKAVKTAYDKATSAASSASAAQSTADSAASAASKAQSTANTAKTTAAAALPKSGGTMAGPLTLKSDPTSDLQAATKQYVDKKGTSMPVGSIYVQFSGQAAPSDLFGGTWSNVSSTYAGRFFRAEGGSAAAFGSTQGHGAPNATGGVAPIAAVSNLDSYGALSWDMLGQNSVSGSGHEQGRIVMDLSKSNSTYGSANEVRPINSTIRIWKRTA